jgi:hypothetical protein
MNAATTVAPVFLGLGVGGKMRSPAFCSVAAGSPIFIELDKRVRGFIRHNSFYAIHGRTAHVNLAAMSGKTRAA